MHMSFALKRAAKRGLATVAAALAVTVLAAPAAFAAPFGDAVATDPSTNAALGGPQDLSKLFTMKLPVGAACPGNTASGGFKIFSFMVPDGFNPLTLNFSAGFYNSGTGLYDATGTYYNFGGANTASLGEITTVPLNLQMSKVVGVDFTEAQLIAQGVWDAGIICADATGQAVRYWDQKVFFDAAPATGVGRWTALPHVLEPANTNQVLLPLSAAGLLAGGYFVSRRKRSDVATIA
jgi:hypothetical protein